MSRDISEGTDPSVPKLRTRRRLDREPDLASGANRSGGHSDRRISIAYATRMMKRQMERIDIAPIPEFIGVRRRLRRPPLRLQGNRRHGGPDHAGLPPKVDEITSVGEFYGKAAGGQIVFT
jgi:hypothetical protein